MSLMSRCFFDSNSGVTCATTALRWISLSRRESALQRIGDASGPVLILILSDINMPGMSGLELLPKAKAARPDVPVIMITAYGDDATKQKALDGGAHALLTKPIDFAVLRGEIDCRVTTAA